MSANLYWEPVKRKKHELNIGAPSSFMETLERAFGSKTPRLGVGSVSKLEGMYAAASSENFRDGYQAILDGIERHDEIQISAEY